jgi:hypothetical protein
MYLIKSFKNIRTHKRMLELQLQSVNNWVMITLKISTFSEDLKVVIKVTLNIYIYFKLKVN